MLCRVFNQFKNRRLLQQFEVQDGNHKGYSLTLEIKALQEADPESLPGFLTDLKELPWDSSLIGTRETLLSAHSVAKRIETSLYYRTGKAFDAFVKPEGVQQFYAGDDVLLGLPTGKHQILLLPKGAIPHEGYTSATPRGPLHEAYRPSPRLG